MLHLLISQQGGSGSRSAESGTSSAVALSGASSRSSPNASRNSCNRFGSGFIE
jgi:hypothetical protein